MMSFSDARPTLPVPVHMSRTRSLRLMHGGGNHHFLCLSIYVQNWRVVFGHSPTRPRLCAGSVSPSDSDPEAMKSQMLPRDASESHPDLSRAGDSTSRSSGGGLSIFPPASASFAISRTSAVSPLAEPSLEKTPGVILEHPRANHVGELAEGPDLRAEPLVGEIRKLGGI